MKLADLRIECPGCNDLIEPEEYPTHHRECVPEDYPAVTWDADDGGPGQDYNSAFQDLRDPW